MSFVTSVTILYKRALESWQLSQILYCTTPKKTKNEKPLSKVSSVQYSPRRQSRWVLTDYGGKDLWKR